MIHNLTSPVTHRRPAPPRRALFGLMADAIAGAWNAAVLHRAMRRDEYFLLSQPDYILRDIGIGRSEVEAAVRGRPRR